MSLLEFIADNDISNMVGFMKYLNLKYGMSGSEIVNWEWEERELKKDYEDFQSIVNKQFVQS